MISKSCLKHVHCNQEDNNHYLINIVKKKLKYRDFLIYNQKNHILDTFNDKIIIYYLFLF